MHSSKDLIRIWYDSDTELGLVIVTAIAHQGLLANVMNC